MGYYLAGRRSPCCRNPMSLRPLPRDDRTVVCLHEFENLLFLSQIFLLLSDNRNLPGTAVGRPTIAGLQCFVPGCSQGKAFATVQLAWSQSWPAVRSRGQLDLGPEQPAWEERRRTPSSRRANGEHGRCWGGIAKGREIQRN